MADSDGAGNNNDTVAVVAVAAAAKEQQLEVLGGLGKTVLAGSQQGVLYRLPFSAALSLARVACS